MNLRPRAPCDRAPRVPPPRRSPTRLAAVALAARPVVAPTRATRPQPSRSATTSLSALRSAAALADFHRAPLCRVPVGRNPRVLPPRVSARPGRPRSTRSFTASLFASQSAAARALVDGASPGALWSPPVRSELPAFHLGVRQGFARSMQEAARVASAWAAEAHCDRTGRVGSLRAGRVTCRQDGPHGQRPREFQQARRRGGTR